MWKRQGEYAVLVSRQSAIQIESRPDDVFPINQNHSDMVKFSPNDANYKMVLDYLRQITSPQMHVLQALHDPGGEQSLETCVLHID